MSNELTILWGRRAEDLLLKSVPQATTRPRQIDERREFRLRIRKIVRDNLIKEGIEVIR